MNSFAIFIMPFRFVYFQSFSEFDGTSLTNKCWLKLIVISMCLCVCVFETAVKKSCKITQEKCKHLTLKCIFGEMEISSIFCNLEL